MKTYQELRDEYFQGHSAAEVELTDQIKLEFEGDLVGGENEDGTPADVRKGDINIRHGYNLIGWFKADDRIPSVASGDLARNLMDEVTAYFNGTQKTGNEPDPKQPDITYSKLQADLEQAEAAYLDEQIKTARLEGAISVYERLIPAGFNSLNKTN